MGGNCGLDFNHETARARWTQARHRFIREQKRLQAQTVRTIEISLRGL